MSKFDKTFTAIILFLCWALAMFYSGPTKAATYYRESPPPAVVEYKYAPRVIRFSYSRWAMDYQTGRILVCPATAEAPDNYAKSECFTLKYSPGAKEPIKVNSWKYMEDFAPPGYFVVAYQLPGAGMDVLTVYYQKIEPPEPSAKSAK